MKKNLEIMDYENKSTAAMKPYVRFQTSEGWMSCFNLKECEKLKKYKGKTACVEVTESIVNEGKDDERKFHNIQKCYGEENISEVNKDEAEVETQRIPERHKNNSATMYASYAKDIFCVMWEKGFDRKDAGNIMNDATTLVKQAKEAFE